MGEWGNVWDQFLFTKNGKEPSDLIVTLSTGINYKDNKILYVGDFYEIDGKRFVVVNHEYGFKGESIDDGSYQIFTTDVIDKMVVVGNIFETPEYLKN